ncbi:hypothetical protein M422DRAFT_246344 [Sphaerobolus stellatus SS14]|nr:hypothetical protein M422DRAFT_246344 [Sphaerobolus stellatus SS14]
MAYYLCSTRNDGAYGDALQQILIINNDRSLRTTTRGHGGWHAHVCAQSQQVPTELVDEEEAPASQLTESGQATVEPTEEEVRQNRERICEAHLLQNEREHQADEIDRFFAQPPPLAPSPLPPFPVL